MTPVRSQNNCVVLKVSEPAMRSVASRRVRKSRGEQATAKPSSAKTRQRLSLNCLHFFLMRGVMLSLRSIRREEDTQWAGQVAKSARGPSRLKFLRMTPLAGLVETKPPAKMKAVCRGRILAGNCNQIRAFARQERTIRNLPGKSGSPTARNRSLTRRTLPLRSHAVVPHKIPAPFDQNFAALVTARVFKVAHTAG